MPLEGREGAWAGAKGPELERRHQDSLRRALKEAACSVARGRWSDMEAIDAREAERRERFLAIPNKSNTHASFVRSGGGVTTPCPRRRMIKHGGRQH